MSHYHNPTLFTQRHNQKQIKLEKEYNASMHQHQQDQKKSLYHNNREKKKSESGNMNMNMKKKMMEDKDHMAINEPEGPEYKYHEMKKMKENYRQQQEMKQQKYNEMKDNQSRYGFQQPPQPNAEQQFKQTIEDEKYNELYTEKPAHKIHFDGNTTTPSQEGEGEERVEKERKNGKDDIGQGEYQSEFRDFYGHNERLEKFMNDRAAFGNKIPDQQARDAHEEQQKQEAKKKENAKKEKEKKKKKPLTPEEVDLNARKYIKQFMLKIHPDFFHQDAAKRNANIHNTFLFFF